MKLRKIFFLISMLAMGGVNSAFADLTCDLTRSGSDGSYTGSVSGTLTVNTIGTVAAANITAWNITVTTTAGSVNLTNPSSTLVPAQTMTSTASSLTITSTDTEYFQIWFTNPGNGQYYAIGNTFETFRYGATTGTHQVINTTSVPNPLNLTCTCAVGGGVTSCGSAVNAPIDLHFSKQVETFATDIEIQ